MKKMKQNLVLIGCLIATILLCLSAAPDCLNAEDGTHYPDYDDCAKFYICSNGIAYHFECSGNLVYNHDIQACDYSSRGCSSTVQDGIACYRSEDIDTYRRNFYLVQCDPQTVNIFTSLRCGNSIRGALKTQYIVRALSCKRVS